MNPLGRGIPSACPRPRSVRAEGQLAFRAFGGNTCTGRLVFPHFAGAKTITAFRARTQDGLATGAGSGLSPGAADDFSLGCGGDLLPAMRALHSPAVRYPTATTAHMVTVIVPGELSCLGLRSAGRGGVQVTGRDRRQQSSAKADPTRLAQLPSRLRRKGTTNPSIWCPRAGLSPAGLT
jgi:hypothetical protein